MSGPSFFFVAQGRLGQKTLVTRHRDRYSYLDISVARGNRPRGIHDPTDRVRPGTSAPMRPSLWLFI